jgi:hypothetical protein
VAEALATAVVVGLALPEALTDGLAVAVAAGELEGVVDGPAQKAIVGAG